MAASAASDGVHSFLNLRVGEGAIEGAEHESEREADLAFGDALALVAGEFLDALERWGRDLTNRPPEVAGRGGGSHEHRQIAGARREARQGLGVQVFAQVDQGRQRVEIDLGDEDLILGREPVRLRDDRRQLADDADERAIRRRGRRPAATRPALARGPRGTPARAAT